MAGTIEGGKKAAATNIAKYGKDFYKKMGQKGGRNGYTEKKKKRQAVT